MNYINLYYLYFLISHKVNTKIFIFFIMTKYTFFLISYSLMIIIRENKFLFLNSFLNNIINK